MSATYVLIPGAASTPGYWDPVADLLRSRGHEVIPVEIPCDDDAAGLAEYVDTAVAATGDREGVIVVGHSFGGFTAAAMCERVDAALLVLVQAMVPKPGETPGDWWVNTGYADAAGGGDGDAGVPDTHYHDVSPEMTELGNRNERGQSDRPTDDAWPLEAWPDVPTRFILCTEDRFFSADLLRGVVEERLGISPDEIETGHMPMLAKPEELADRLEAFRREIEGSAGAAGGGDPPQM